MVEKVDSNNAKKRLLDAGATLFAEKGFAGTSVREICDLAGTGNNMIHHYFGNKQGLREAIVSRFTSEVFAMPIRLIQKPPKTQEDFVSRFEMFVEETLEAMIDNRCLFIMIHKEDAQPEQDPFDEYYSSFTSFIKGGQKNGWVHKKIDSTMLSGLVIDRLGNQIHYANVINRTTGTDIISDKKYRDRWLRANLDLFLYGFIAN